MLKYNAEVDSIHNLSKKHHVNSYPTAIVLNTKARVVSRKFGFPGGNSKNLITNVLDFTNHSISLYAENHFVVGYSGTINLSKYPDFYKSYWSGKKDKDVDEKVISYLKTKPDIFSEEYFSVITIFAKYLPKNGEIPSEFLQNKEKYINLFGKADVNTTLVFFSFEKFENAIEQKSEKLFKEAKYYVSEALGKETDDKMTAMFSTKFKEALKK